MWLAFLVPVLALAAAEPQPGAASPAVPTTPAPVFTRQSLFAIPFRIDRPDRITQEPVEVQLYVSGDRGAHWDFYRKTDPARQHFLFRAGIDGEYWFHVRTLDRSGQVRPGGPAAPGLRVIVDTTPPKLQLEARRGNAGQVTASFQIEEPYPKLDSLSIQYRIGPGAAWQAVALGRQDVRATGPTHGGEVTWWPPAGNGLMEIRAEVADMAGNPAVSNAQLAMDAGRSTTAVAASDPKPPTTPAGPTTDPSQPADTWRPSGSDPPPTHWPATNASPGSQGQVALTGDGRKADPQTGSVVSPVNPPISSQYVVPGEKTARASTMPAAGSGATPGPQVRTVSSRVFELEYDAQSVGPSGISRVELWATRDEGQTWRSLGIDEDRRSPFVVTVDEEGTYGFRIAIQSGAGLGGKAPQRGDLPEIRIGVDMTKPTGRITAAQQGQGADADKLTIGWEASDNLKLAGRPISISYGETLGGPWKTIANGLENTGHYTWALDSRLPQRVHLRLEIRDEAGNIGICETPEPISLDHSVPTARIREVHPLGESNQRGPGRDYYR